MPAKQRNEAAADDAKAILNRVRQLVRALRVFDKEAQSRYGIGAAQMFILHVLSNEDDLTLGELADRTATDQSSVSLAAGKLVDEGYVRRAPSKDDRRLVRLSLTPKARALVRRSPPAAQSRMLDSVAAMSGAERKQLVKLLDKLMSGLGVDGSSAPMLFEDDLTAARGTRRRTR